MVAKAVEDARLAYRSKPIQARFKRLLQEMDTLEFVGEFSNLYSKIAQLDRLAKFGTSWFTGHNLAGRFRKQSGSQPGWSPSRTDSFIRSQLHSA